MRLKMKNRSHRYDINMEANILNSKCLSIKMVKCIKQLLSYI